MRGGRAEIVGAGIAGLTAAICLARTGWSVRVHERAPALRELGAGLYVKENALRVLLEVGTWKSLQGTSVPMEEALIIDQRDGVLTQRSFDDEHLVVMSRRRLHAALADTAHALGVEIQCGSEVVEVTPQGSLRTTGGVEATADLVVGADGVRSPVAVALGLRKQVWEHEDGTTRLIVPRSTVDLGSRVEEHWSGAHRIGIAACSETETYIFLVTPNRTPAGCATPVDPAFWRRLFPSLAPALEAAAGAPARHDPNVTVFCGSWVAGRVAILGDAAHAQCPHLGQGACLAIANAAALADSVGSAASSGQLPDALLAWDEQRRADTEEVQRWSFAHGRLATAWPQLLYDMRSRVVQDLYLSPAFRKKFLNVWRGNADHDGQLRARLGL